MTHFTGTIPGTFPQLLTLFKKSKTRRGLNSARFQENTDFFLKKGRNFRGYFQAFEGAKIEVEFRLINLESNTTFSLISAVSGDSSILNKSEAASIPIFVAGWVTVVKDGFSSGAISKLEKPTTFTSAGIEIFRSVQA